MKVKVATPIKLEKSCPYELPVETIIKTPVGVLPFIFLPHNGWEVVLDDDVLLDIAHASWVRL